jgi:hypothetical protein
MFPLFKKRKDGQAPARAEPTLVPPAPEHAATFDSSEGENVGGPDALASVLEEGVPDAAPENEPARAPEVLAQPGRFSRMMAKVKRSKPTPSVAPASVAPVQADTLASVPSELAGVGPVEGSQALALEGPSGLTLSTTNEASIASALASTAGAVIAGDEAPLEGTPSSKKGFRLKGLFSKAKAGESPVVDEDSLDEDETSRRFKLMKFFGKSETLGFTPLPIRVLLGYFPEISKKDALEYAQGVAEKHFEQPGMVHYGAFEYDTGFIYEVHEGGEGKAFTPAILKYFKSQGPFKTGEHLSAVIKTATRLVEVQRLRDGIATILLPESTPRQPTAWLKGTRPLTSAMNRRTAFFGLSALVFATGVVAMLATGLLFRIQPFDLNVAPTKLTITTQDLPRTQWQRLSRITPGSYVKALRYRNGKWESPELGADAVVAPMPVPGDSSSAGLTPAAPATVTEGTP